MVVAEPYLPLFVYGTLRDNESLESLVGPIVDRRPAAVANGRWQSVAPFPAVSFQVADEQIPGELVWLSPSGFQSAIAELDDYERVPDLYRRIRIVARSNEGEVEAYAYEWRHNE